MTTRWRSFVEFVVMRELGQSDAVYRNYNLLYVHNRGNPEREPHLPGIVLDRAFKRMGFEPVARPFLLPWVRAHLRNAGYNAGTDEDLSILIREWYTWDRIRSGDLRQWPLKQVSNPLL